MVTQCFNCQGYGHTAKRCKGKKTCGFCAKDHDTRTCPTAEDPSTYSCINCKGKHVTWSLLCPERAARASKARAAYANRPMSFRIPAKFTPHLPNPPPPLPPPSSSSPPQTQPIPTRTHGLVPNLAPIQGKRSRTSSNSTAQSLPKKSCPTSSSSSHATPNLTLATSSYPATSFLPQSDACSHLRPCSVCIMTASNIARSPSPEL
jgi:hypothetical protein